MSRLFDGTDDQMVYPAPAALSGALTMLIVVKFGTASGWASLLEAETSGGADRATIGRNPNQSNNLYWSNGVAGLPTGGVTLTNTTNWYVVAVTRASGTVAARTHRCQIGSASNTHTDHSGTMSNAGSVAGGVLRIGGNADFASVRVAAAAVWDGTVLSDADIDGIASAATTQSIADLSPTWLVDDSDAFATDLIGSSDRTSITGTADDADDPSGWVYGLGGGPTPVTSDREVTWDVQNSVVSDREVTWDVQNSVVSSRQVTWDVVNAVVSTREVTWDVEGDNPVSERQIIYDIQGSVVSDREVTWDVQAAVTSTREVTWDVINAVTSSRQVTWDVINAVTSSRLVRYDVGDVIVVDNGLLLRRVA